MSNLRSVLGAAFVFVLALGATGCGSKTIRTNGLNPAQNRDAGTNRDSRADSAGGMDSMPGPDQCLSKSDSDRREPGQACVCATDCTTGNCEGGVCCSGAACGAKRPEGAACTDAAQCMSGFCADGVCCNVECTGACLACNQADMMGECAPVGAGLDDPHGLCRKDSPQSCGQSGVCNGQGGCAKHPADTICALGTCDPAGLFVPPSTCDGEGQCVAGVGISCSPSKCDVTKGECVRICTGNDQCVDGKACTDGSCGLRGPGQACTAGTECASKFCVDGVCCESACTGACQTCSNPMKRGMCVPVAKGVTDPLCGAPTPTSSCGNDGKCDDKGACSKWDNNTTCRAARCDASSNSQVLAAKCNNGACPAEQKKNCAPFKGCATATACLGACGSDAQCDGNNVCTKGSCGKVPVGGKCSNNGECQNGICAQGYCCNSACGGACKSCGLAGSLGTCTNVPAGSTDPGGGCKDECSKVCDGNGACRREPINTPCGAAPSCNANTIVQKKCNGTGTCAQANVTCGGGTPMCKDGACTTPAGKDAGQQCVNAGECKTGLSCAPAAGGKNICCTQACGGSCQWCADSGSGCAERPDNTSCGGSSKCSGGLCCADGTTKCGNVCINLQTNKDNCGMCGKKCAAGESCKMGSCMVDCANTICDGKCVDTKSDVNNCGACGTKCGANSVCNNGVCGCTVPLTRCGNACVNTADSEAHCGGCNKPCATGATCTGGVCMAACVPKTCAGEGWECGTLAKGCNMGNETCGPCPNGKMCNTDTHKCVDQCVPKTCAGEGWECGSLNPGCGGSNITCGPCSGTNVCNTATHKCDPPCPEVECGDKCGTVTNSCGKSKDCGGCTNPATCQSNACVCPDPSCTGKCGTVTNACGKSKDCGTSNCQAGETCQSNACVCPEPSCTGKCGTVTNACGSSKDCGGCANGAACQSNTCNCPEPSCTGKCGTVTNACGNSASCGGCDDGATCQSNMCSCPEPSCTNKCGTVTNACGNSAACGGCDDDRVCQSNACNCPDVVCGDKCGMITNKCGKSKDCGECPPAGGGGGNPP